ncbi:hypothetical protein M9H77_23522 [Catharanthus roseus]|uniref:Uncharacterized protein n=1 Tax=Catharanthus roseus TaxID=4058 RepID=A0ACC0AVP3_CATRO|nr:hypothetical protein M9H77_23522 [Catharanthus roseus]
MKIIMQELQLMRKDMKEMRGNIINLCIEHRDQSKIEGHITFLYSMEYGNFSPHAITFEHNSYYCHEGNRLEARNSYNYTSCKRVPRNEIKNGENYVKMDERFHKRRGDIERYHDSYDHYEHSYGSKDKYIDHNDSYSYGGYNYKRSSQTLGTTSRPLSYNNLKLSLLCGTFGAYDYVAWEQNMESLFYSYNDCKCENRKRIGSQPIKTWNLMRQALRNRFGIRNHEGQRQGQTKEKSMESSMGKKSTKVYELSQAQDVVDKKVIHHDEKKTCTFIKEEKSREEKVKSEK